MSLIVQKFGGSSLATPARMERAGQIIRVARRAGHEVAAVLSAQGDTTDALLARARELSPCPAPRELDMLLATGEQQSVSLMAMVLQAQGVEAVSLAGWQLPLKTDGAHGAAHILGVGRERVSRELAAGRVVLAAGFQGVNAAGDVTTLGRGGSDTSAVALAAWLGVSLCQIYTDVDGVYSADPRLCPTAKRLERVSYPMMCLLAREGAKVLAARAAALGEALGVPLEILSCEENSARTRIVSEETDESVTGVTMHTLDDTHTQIVAVGRAFPSRRLRECAEAALRGADIPAKTEEEPLLLRITVPAAFARGALCAVHDALYAEAHG